MQKQDFENKRMVRLLGLVQDIRLKPRQTIQNILEKYAISRSQFYKDKQILLRIGFAFRYTKKEGFLILEDKLS